VELLEKKVDGLWAWKLLPTETSLTQEAEAIKLRGPKTIADAELQARRDGLVRFLESNWPDLEFLCGPSSDLGVLKQRLAVFAQGSRGGMQMIDHHSLAAKRLLTNFSQLELLLKKHEDRFAGNPRQIANAIAGCPDMVIWTSLKRCQHLPCEVVIDERAVRAHIRRKHPKLYEVLSEQPSLPELAAFKAKYRTKDETIKSVRAVDLKRFWKAGTVRDGIAWTSAVILRRF
jgi:hypothetical protein